MTSTPDGVVAFEYGGAEFQMVFDMKAIAYFERETGTSIVTALAELEDAKRLEQAPKLSTIAYLVQAGLRRHHPEVSPERAMRMVSDPNVQQALGAGVEAAMPPPGDETDRGAEGNAATPAKAGKASTGTRSKKPRSKRG